MTSSTDDHRHVSAPPPTPSASLPPSSTPNNLLLSHLLLRLPPALSLSPPTRRPPSTTALPSLSFSSETLPLSLLSAANRLGILQLTNHSVPPHLAQSAESECSLCLSPPLLDRPWPVGRAGTRVGPALPHDESLCFDSKSFGESTRSLGELARELERVGMQVLEAVGFGDPTQVLPLMWVSEKGRGDESDGPGQVYPYVVGLEYQIRSREVSLLGDSGWVSVSPQVDSILVTFGDIAQVWSNGKIKKVRGRPVPVITDEVPNNSNDTTTKCVSMTMLLTLPLESTVSPQLPQTLKAVQGENFDEIDEDKMVFDSFSFEDYAWRVYHERFHLKDSLDRYRTRLV